MSNTKIKIIDDFKECSILGEVEQGTVFQLENGCKMIKGSPDGHGNIQCYSFNSNSVCRVGVGVKIRIYPNAKLILNPAQ